MIIQGPGIGNLALIDLPGLIQATDLQEDTKYIDMVQNLVLSYIKKASAIIAMVISCKDDMENQSIKVFFFFFFIGFQLRGNCFAFRSFFLSFLPPLLFPLKKKNNHSILKKKKDTCA